MVIKKLCVCLIMSLMLSLFTSCNNVSIPKSNDQPTSNNVRIPQTIIWNNSAYIGTGQFVQNIGKKIGNDNEGQEIFQDPDNPNSNEIVLVFRSIKLKYKLYDFNEDSAVSMVLDQNSSLGKAKNKKHICIYEASPLKGENKSDTGDILPD